MKRLVVCILVAVLLLTVLPALADAARTSGLYTYEIKGNGTITITGFNWSEHSGDVFIPAMIDGYTVAGIGNSAFKDGDEFNGNSSNKNGIKTPIKVVLPDTIKSIGNKAFFSSGITEINIPDSIQYIGSAAFADCPFLHFIVSQRHPYFAIIDTALYSKANKELLYYPYFYDECSGHVIPDGIVSIGDYALYHCFRGRGKPYSYTAVKLPNTLRRIGDYAFSGAEIYTAKGYFPKSLESIGEGAFSYASFQGEDLHIPSSVSSIGEGCFANTDSILYEVFIELGKYDLHHERIVIPTNSALTTIPAKAFLNSEVDILLYSPNIERIEDLAFGTDTAMDHGTLYPYNAENRVDYNLFKNLEYIGVGAFSHIATNSVHYAETVLAESKDNTFPAKLSAINPHFNLDISLPSSVRTIEANAYVKVVNDFYLPTTLTQISPDAFAQGSTFIVEAGSYAELWALENGFAYSIEGQDNLDWLNN